jgi:hypothetical protein
MNSNVFQVLHTAVMKLHNRTLLQEGKPKYEIVLIIYNQSYRSPEEAVMADVTLLNEDKHPPGKIYSLMKPGLRLYSS